MEGYPRIVLLFSGKRKSGKDFITDKLKESLGNKCEILKISAPIKEYFAKCKGLDFEVLMSEKPNKEQVRLEMIIWSEEKRAQDPGYFCNIACKNAKSSDIWLVSDVRRKTDIAWFLNHYRNKVKTVRINADMDVRKQRGFQFQEGVDDAKSECDLDDYSNWHLQIFNNNETTCKMSIDKVLELIKVIE